MYSMAQQFCLRWNNHLPNFIQAFSDLLESQSLVDVTLSAEGRQIQAHKVVLAACSTYFQALFANNPCRHPVIIMRDVEYNDVKTLIDFIYKGEVNVSQEQLTSVLKTADSLQIKGLAEIPSASRNLTPEQTLASAAFANNSIPRSRSQDEIPPMKIQRMSFEDGTGALISHGSECRPSRFRKLHRQQRIKRDLECTQSEQEFISDEEGDQHSILPNITMKRQMSHPSVVIPSPPPKSPTSLEEIRRPYLIVPSPTIIITADAEGGEQSSSGKNEDNSTLKRSASSPQYATTKTRGHCPELRSGSAVGCDYCWNKTDPEGRIQRRKTKYRCPECGANLCIVPCFQEFHKQIVEMGEKVKRNYLT
ncbi:unnamed protein product, partial [Darwinula stevensoni]